MTTPTTYDSSTIDRIRKMVAKHTHISKVLDTLSARLKLSRDHVRRLQRQYQFWRALVPVAEQVTGGRPIKRLFLDLETAANIVLSWRIGRKVDLNYTNILKERAIICACYKWEGESTVHSLTWDSNQDDKSLLEKLLEVINEADEVIGHNVARFDLPWVKTRCIFHGLQSLPDYKIVDTLQIARRRFYFNSNRLDYIAKYLGLGQKLETGFGLWKDVMLNKCPVALKKMVTYCQNDIVILEKVYQRLSAATPHKTHAGVLSGAAKWSCPKDGSTNVMVSKTRVSASGAVSYQMRCRDCGAYYMISTTAHDAYLEDKKVGQQTILSKDGAIRH